MQPIIITTQNELQALVISAINTCLDYRSLPATQEKPTEIISRDELCKRLAITEPTVIRWEKKGKIPSIRIGSSVRYNWQAVVDALENKKEVKK